MPGMVYHIRPEYTLVDLSRWICPLRNARSEPFRSALNHAIPCDESATNPKNASNTPERAKFLNEPHPEVPEEIRNLLRELSLNGGLEMTRTSDLFRVKEAL